LGSFCHLNWQIQEIEARDFSLHPDPAFARLVLRLRWTPLANAITDWSRGAEVERCKVVNSQKSPPLLKECGIPMRRPSVLVGVNA